MFLKMFNLKYLFAKLKKIFLINLENKKLEKKEFRFLLPTVSFSEANLFILYISYLQWSLRSYFWDFIDYNEIHSNFRDTIKLLDSFLSEDYYVLE